MHRLQSPVSLVYGLLCVTATLVVLFAGHSLNDLTVNHLYIVLSLVVAVGSGHYMWEANGGWVKGSAFTLLFIVATILCVGLSGGRSSELLQNKEHVQSDVIHKKEAQQGVVTRLRKELDAAEQEYVIAKTEFDDASRKAATECDGGKGKLCDGKRTTEASARTTLDSAKLTRDTKHSQWATESQAFEAIRPPPQANADLLQFARVVKMVTGMSEARAFEAVKLLLPYAIALVAEFGAILFFNHAFRHVPLPEVKVAPKATITIAHIAGELNIQPRVARKALRELGVDRPAEGWIWTPEEAASIRLRIGSEAR